jgi:prepilin-type N-terminal cleavage/methylation domain-containing protein
VRRRAGFTLTELLVVMGIIAILAGLILPAVGAVRRSAASRAAKATIERIRLACQAYQADFGDYPPTSLVAFDVTTNGVNDGIESLLRCLTTRREHGPYLEFEEPDLANTDGDSLTKADPVGSALEARTLFELADPWGNPYIYFHNRDYRGGAKLERYIFATGERMTCRPRPSEKTGQFPSMNSFLVWSAGPDGKNEDGQGDDVCSWK